MKCKHPEMHLARSLRLVGREDRVPLNPADSRRLTLHVPSTHICLCDRINVCVRLKCGSAGIINQLIRLLGLFLPLVTRDAKPTTRIYMVNKYYYEMFVLKLCVFGDFVCLTVILLFCSENISVLKIDNWCVVTNFCYCIAILIGCIGDCDWFKRFWRSLKGLYFIFQNENCETRLKDTT